MRRALISVFVCFLAICSLTQCLFAAELKLGVNAPRGELNAKQSWTELAKYLSGQLGQTVTLVTLHPSKVVSSTMEREVDFVLSHASHTINLQERHGSTPIATINGNHGPWFAGVIIAKKGSGIRTAEDLRGKKVMSMKFRAAAGAYMFQTYHLLKKGIDPHKDFGSIQWVEKQDDLVLAIKLGLIDAGFVRTGMLESMEKEGRIKMADFVVVDERQGDKMSLVHTTDLYPEWYFSVMPNVSKDTAAKVKAALVEITDTMPAAQAARVRGFVDPLPLDGMRELLKTLNLPPYKTL
jgi:ABC-type phosphate/phosphonate transport system substrate-binding protein